MIMSLQPKGRGWGHIAFGADPVSVRLASCLHSISWTNKWILTKLAKTYYLEGGNWLDFGDLDLIFKVTPALWNFQILTPKSLSASYLLNQMTDFSQTSFIVTLGSFKDLIRFWWPWLNFQGHHTIKTVLFSNFDHKSLSTSYLVNQMMVCTLSPEPIGGFWPNMHKTTAETWERND